MAKNHGNSIDGDDRHRPLRGDGMTNQQAARVAGSAGTAGRWDESSPYDDWTKAELYERAQEVGIDGRSSMSKSELISALRSA
jgi:hypothetical protein